MTKTAKEILLDYAFETATANERGDGKRWDSAVDKALKELEAIHQQEITKAEIRILEQERSWIEDVNRDIGWSIEQTIKSLSQTLKELEAEL